MHCPALSSVAIPSWAPRVERGRRRGRGSAAACRARLGSENRPRGESRRRNDASSASTTATKSRGDVRATAASREGSGLFNLEDIAKPFISAKETLNEGGVARASTRRERGKGGGNGARAA